MVQFGKALKEQRQEKWQYAYLSYDSLKEQLELICTVANEERRRVERAQKIRPLKIMFQRHLDSEIMKVLEFYNVTLMAIRENVEEFSKEQEELIPDIKVSAKSSGDDLAKPLKFALIGGQQEKWREVATTTVHLLEYISLNMRALRKIVKKHSKNVEPLMPSEEIGATRVIEIQHPDEPHSKLVQATFLHDDYISHLASMQQHQELKNVSQTVTKALAELQYWATRLEATTTEGREDELHFDMEVGTSPNRFFGGSLGSFVGSPLASLGASSSMDMPSDVTFMELKTEGGKKRPGRANSLMLWRRAITDIHEFEPVLKQLGEAAEKAERDASLVNVSQQWFANQAAIFEKPPKDEAAVATSLGIFLNLLNTFLYMMNYNLVIPLLTPFTTHLSVSYTMGGIIVGAADITAMIAAVFYSVWTNRSFRKPLLFSAYILIISNVCFSLAWDVGGTAGLALLLASRFITGLGAARALNRRYIADFVKKENRTKASAGFVGASSLGMAAGPFMAKPLGYIPQSAISFLTINNVTMAGWVMVFLWVCFLVIALLFFAEPPRKKLTSTPSSMSDIDTDTQPLLEDGSDINNGEIGTVDRAQRRLPPPHKKFNFWKDRSCYPTLVTVALLFMLKLEQQGAMSSVPLFTKPYDWSEATVGLFLAFMGIIVLPVNILLGVLSTYIKDRELCMASLLLCVGGAGTVIMWEGGAMIPEGRYLAGFVIIYVATIVMEGAAMSLMSKVIAPELANGTFNAGLLATDSGSFGRFMGNCAITLIGGWIGISEGVVVFGNVIYGSFVGAAVICTLFMILIYKKLKA